MSKPEKRASSTPTKTFPDGEYEPAATESESHQVFPTTGTSDPVKTREFAIEAARLAGDDKCEDVLLLDVRNLSQISDYIIICSGTSDRQMRSVADDMDELASKHGYPVFRRDADDRTTWIVVDCVDVVLHVFEPNTRAHYDLEMLWADAPRVEWERPGGAGGQGGPGQIKRDRAGLG
jgi:ribosome-associated protein